ncbi:hypothetical protein KAW43_02195 [Candidatus Parcubacteria bacterium]|nr:hypothetical protein [Candidatus Parcubacteria bacterium]
MFQRKKILEGYKNLWRKYFRQQEKAERPYSSVMEEIYERKLKETEIVLEAAQKMLGFSNKEVEQIKEEAMGRLTREQKWDMLGFSDETKKRLRKKS